MSQPTVRPTKKILFFLRAIHYGRVFENALRTILENGHSLHMALVLEKRGLGDDKTKLFDELQATYPEQFSWEQLDKRTDTWVHVASALRHGIDYLRYLAPEYADAGPLRERARDRAPRLLRLIVAIPGFRGGLGRKAVAGFLGWLESGIPVPHELTHLIQAQRPDVVLVSPLVGLGSPESDCLRAAQNAGIPTVLPVASWDNLTNKGILRDIPTLTIVWNEAQVREAVSMHRVPPDRVVSVGAHSFDHWFTWEPATTRQEFGAKRGIDPNRPMILYLGSSFFIAGNEAIFIHEWLSRVRAHPRLKDVAVILRQHPQNAAGWDTLVEEPGRTAIWPKTGESPNDREKKQDYFDTLYHSSAVVGINTSAQIEAAIIGRPVLTMLSDHFTTQDGTLHFSHIAYDEAGGGGVVTVGRSWEEHLDQLADSIETPAAYQARISSFVQAFVRPHGEDYAGAPAFVDAVTKTADTPVRARRRGRVLRVVFWLLTPLVAALLPLFRPRQTWRSLSKWYRRELKELRRRRKNSLRARSKRTKGNKARSKAIAAKTKHAHEKARKHKPDMPVAPTASIVKPSKPAPKPDPVQDELELLMMTPDQVERERERRRNHEREVIRNREKNAAIREEEKKREQAAKMREKRRENIRNATAAQQGRAAEQPSIRKRLKYAKGNARALYNRRNRKSYTTSLARVPSRDELPAVLNARGLVGEGIELGVHKGRFADTLLRTWKGSKLISVDDWNAPGTDDAAINRQKRLDKNFVAAKHRLAGHGERSEIWRLYSGAAARKVEDASLDFAYVNAREDIETFIDDLEIWLPKVKAGGIIAGYDYVDGALKHGRFGVKAAVDAFFGERGLTVHSTDGASAGEQSPSWIVEVLSAEPLDGVDEPGRSGLVEAERTDKALNKRT